MKVSVIIPTYNNAFFIRETVESVLNQTHKDIEIIVVDDGSRDKTREVLSGYMDKIQYIYKENGGPASARNIGIKLAEGEFIAFLDADDIWEKEKIAEQLKRFEDSQAGLVYARVSKIDENGKRLPSGLKKSKYEGDIFNQLFGKNFIPTSTVVARKQCFDRIGIFNEDPQLISVEDYDMWLRIAAHYKIAFVDSELTRYRKHSSAISGNLLKSYLGEKKVLEGIKTRYVEQYPEIENGWQDRLAKLYYELATDFFCCDQFKDARKYYKESLKCRFNLKVFGYYVSTILGRTWINFIRSVRR